MIKNIGVIICLIILSGCGGKNAKPINPDAEMPELVLLEEQSISIAGNVRNYHVFLPSDPANASIVFLLHGNGGSSDQLLGLTGFKAPYKVWIDIARKDNVILVVPDGRMGSNDKQGWNDCRTDAWTNPEGDDVTFLSYLLDEVKSQYGSIHSRVYVTGTSNGGLMTQRLADEIPEKINAIAIVVASKPLNTECIDSTAVLPVLFMNGTDDPILPYDGGEIGSDRGKVLSTPDTVNYWINRNQTELSPVVTMLSDVNLGDGSQVIRYSYYGSAGNPANEFGLVEHYEIVNGGHTEPSIAERYSNLYKLIVGNQNADLEMAEEIWRFFSSH